MDKMHPENNTLHKLFFNNLRSEGSSIFYPYFPLSQIASINIWLRLLDKIS